MLHLLDSDLGLIEIMHHADHSDAVQVADQAPASAAATAAGSERNSKCQESLNENTGRNGAGGEDSRTSGKHVC